jgi:hypothetical protein
MLFLVLSTELILFWAHLHDTLCPVAFDGSQRMSPRHRRVTQIVALSFMWIVYVAVFVFFFVESFEVFNVIYSYVTSFFFAVSAVVCTAVGILVYRRVMLLLLRTTGVIHRVRRVMVTCGIVTFAFVVRAALNAVLPSLNSMISDTQRWIL